MAQPTRDVKRLTRILCETIDPGFGIELIVLAAMLTEPMEAKQVITSFAAEPDGNIAALVDTFSNRIGEKRLYRLSPVDSDVPERSSGWRPYHQPHKKRCHSIDRGRHACCQSRSLSRR